MRLKSLFGDIMETTPAIPVAIKLMMVLVFIDVTATMTFFYLDTLYDPDLDFSDIENLISFIFPLFYFIAMVWLIRSHVAITKIIFYIVFALELAAFIIDFESVAFDIFSILSVTSIVALLGCIYIVHADVGKRWFG
jgi:hypothetical protein